MVIFIVWIAFNHSKQNKLKSHENVCKVKWLSCQPKRIIYQNLINTCDQIKYLILFMLTVNL